jgi:hypothetical protein
MKDLSTIIEEFNKDFRQGRHNNINLDHERRKNKRHVLENQEKKYMKLIEDDDLRKLRY